MFKFAVPFLALALTACATPGQVVFTPAGPNTDAERVVQSQPGRVVYAPTSASATPVNAPSDAQAAQFARNFLNSIQPRSIQQRRELCGYFYMDASGQIAATPPRTGTFAGCDMTVPRAGQNIFASYHTHSAFAPGYDNEVPSAQDLRSDFEFAIDGYVSTPGGRIWHVDFGSRTTRQICGISCVYSDPGFRPIDEHTIQQSFTLPELERR